MSVSEESPYTFHAVGTEGEPVHYELRDVSGRVVCKGLLGAGHLAITAGDVLEAYRWLDGTPRDLEALMRGLVHA